MAERESSTTDQNSTPERVDATGSVSGGGDRTQYDITAQLKLVHEKVTEGEDKLNELNTQINEKIKEGRKSVDDQIAELKRDQINVIQTLSIFVAFFTFVSVEFKVLTTSESSIMHVAGFTLILLGSLTLFVLLIDFVLNTKLSFNKVVEHQSQLTKTFKKISGYTEEIEFKWFSPKSWGNGFKLKFLPLVTLSVVLIVTGLYLVLTPSIVGTFEEEQQVSTSTPIVPEIVISSSTATTTP